MPRLVILWTIGDVNPAGSEALRLSIHGAMRLFGQHTALDAAYRVYVNTISVDDARRRVGPVSGKLEWLQAETTASPLLRPHLGQDMAEGVAWKLMPLRSFPGRFELSLDNDVVLWSMPEPI